MIFTGKVFIELIWALDWFLVQGTYQDQVTHYNLYMGLGIDNSLHDHLS